MQVDKPLTVQDLGFTAYELRLLSFQARCAKFPPVSDCFRCKAASSSVSSKILCEG